MTHSLRPDSQRAVVTGMGIISTIGQDLNTFYQSLIEGKSGITHWKHLDSRCLSKIGGDLSDFDSKKHFEQFKDFYSANLISKALKLFRVTPLSGRLTATASLQAFTDAGLNDFSYPPYRFAHMLGGHNLSSNFMFNNFVIYQEEPDYIDPLFGLVAVDTDILAVTNELLSIQGPCQTIGGACASSNIALVQGLDLIRNGRADLVLVSGGASDVDPVCLQGWCLLDAIGYKSFNDTPQKASRPFDKKREGFVPSISSGAIILESLEHAKKRNANIYAEVLGGSYGSDANRLTKPNSEGQAATIKLALEDSRLEANQIDYVNAHATSTPLGDAIEINALKSVLHQRAYEIPINSTKSMIGHCLTAASVIEFIGCVLQMQHSVVHPTINQEEKDPELDLDFVPNTAKDHKINYFINNAFGFGGINSSVIAGVLN